MIEHYYDIRGKKIVIAELSDKRLLELHGFFRDYMRVIKRTLSNHDGARKSNAYTAYAESMQSVYDALKGELKKRKLKPLNGQTRTTKKLC